MFTLKERIIIPAWMTSPMSSLSLNIQAEMGHLNSIFTNIRSLVSVPAKRNIPKINVDALNKSSIYGPTDTPVLLPPPLLNSSAFTTASNWDILPLLSHSARFSSTR